MHRWWSLLFLSGYGPLRYLGKMEICFLIIWGSKKDFPMQSNLFDVYQDRRGFVWISSGNGLNRFDGTTVTRYFPNPKDSCAIVGENIQSTFFEEDSSALWFTTTQAINRYDWKMDCFHTTLLRMARIPWTSTMLFTWTPHIIFGC